MKKEMKGKGASDVPTIMDPSALPPGFGIAGAAPHGGPPAPGPFEPKPKRG